MPMHDWTRVEAGIYHDFHHEWISEIKRALNRGLLPEDYYALAEQQAAGFGPDVLQSLMDRNTEGHLSPQEREDLELLVELSETLSLLRARAI